VDKKILQIAIEEIARVLRGRALGKIFQLRRDCLAFDFRADGRYLLINCNPATLPRIYLIRRRVRDLEKQSEAEGSFAQFVRKRLSNAVLNNVSKDENDRVARLTFVAERAENTAEIYALVAQLTGRSANLFLIDANGVILDSLRESNRIGQIYEPPAFESSEAKTSSLLEKIEKIVVAPPNDFQFAVPSPLSEKLDIYFSQIEREREFQSLAQAATTALKTALARKEKLLERLQIDLRRHGEPEKLKRCGDLLLANAGAARRDGRRVFLIDYFDENAPEIIVEVEENLTLPEAAEKYFTRYAKARNAAAQLNGRIGDLQAQIAETKTKQEILTKIIERQNIEELRRFVEENKLVQPKPTAAEKKTQSKKEPILTSGIRRYRSSDGLEILVGRNSKDNDYLTLRVAKSLDWWLHAADYGGSHVVVRNPSKRELPPRTLLEAAQLAAKFSQARRDTKVAVNYTQKKFVSKTKNAPAGLVRLSSFRTILVEPKEAAERIL
jgi:predicted ribosome quality control (RQC) complex YloA/Tae2 family protein